MIYMNIALGLLFLHIFLHFLFKPKGAIYCGLFGGCFNEEINSLILEKLKALGLFNQQRGKDSCGYYNGNDIYKGIDDEKEFYDLVVKKGIILGDGSNKIFIGHTRQATYGLSSFENAHPFNINNQLIIAHNGTISNIWDLCRTHGVDHSSIFVDSKGLGSILAKDGPKVLEEYKGFAALLMHRLSEPNSMYIYHGKSSEWENLEETEERPLFMLKTVEGIYLSSMANALEFIRDKALDGEVKVVPHNKIIKLENGDVSDQLPITIDRGVCNMKTYPVTNYHNTAKYGQGKLSLSPDKESIIDIVLESLPARSFERPASVFFHGGRYKRGHDLCQGSYRLNKKTGEVLGKDENAQRVFSLFFHKGVLLKGQKEYDLITTALLEENKELELAKNLTSDYNNFAKVISRYSRYPVRNLSTESIHLGTEGKYKWYLDEKLANGSSLSPVFADRCYHFKMGDLIKIIPDRKEEKVLLENKITPQAKNTDISDFNDDIAGIVKTFKKKYKKFEEAVEEIGDFGMLALSNYMEDVLVILLDENTNTKCVETLSKELIYEAIERQITIESLFDPQLNPIEDYIVTVLKDFSKIDTKVEGEIDYTEVEEIHADVPPMGILRGNPEDTEIKELIDKGLQTARELRELQDEHKNIIVQAPVPVEMVENDEYSEEYKKLEEDDDAAQRVDDIIEAARNLHTLATQFQLLNFSDLAQNIATKLFNAHSTITSDIRQIYLDDRKTEAAMKIKKELTT